MSEALNFVLDEFTQESL